MPIVLTWRTQEPANDRAASHRIHRNFLPDHATSHDLVPRHASQPVRHLDRSIDVIDHRAFVFKRLPAASVFFFLQPRPSNILEASRIDACLAGLLAQLVSPVHRGGHRSLLQYLAHRDTKARP